MLIEARRTDSLIPIRVLPSRDRVGAYLISLCTGTALLALFFFLTLFLQDVWGYTPLQTALAYLPFVGVLLVMTVVTQRALTKIGARPLLFAGTAVAVGGMVWLSRIAGHSTFAGGCRAPSWSSGSALPPRWC